MVLNPDQRRAVAGLPRAPSSAATALLCTLSDVRNRRGITTTEHDTVITQIIEAVQVAFEQHCGRSLIQNDSDVTEYYTGQGQYLQVNRYPIISITSIKEATDYDFTNATALVADDDYRLIALGKKGILYSLLGSWDSEPDSVQIVYRGGYCGADLTPDTGETAVPADLREAAILQSVWIFQRKDDMGLLNISGVGGSISKQIDMTLLPYVQRLLDRGGYVKPSL
jgi:hypothetical protein